MPRTFKRRNKIKNILIAIFICSIIGIILLGAPIWRVSPIVIEGSSYYSNKEIIYEAGLWDQMHILQLNKKRSIKTLLLLPYIHKVEISVTYPNVVKIIIVERKPIGYVPFSGTYLCIDRTGRVIDQKESHGQYDLPIVEGLKFDKFVLGEQLEVDNDEGIMATIEMTTLMEKYNLLDKAVKIDVEDIGRIHLYINSLDVIIGEMSDLDKKIQWLCEIIDENKMGVLDLSNIANGQAIMSPLM